MQQKAFLKLVGLVVLFLPGFLVYFLNLDQFPAYFWDEVTYFRFSSYILQFIESGRFYSLYLNMTYPNLSEFFFAFAIYFNPTIYSTRYVSAVFTFLTGIIIYKILKMHVPWTWAIFGVYLYYFCELTMIFGRMAMLDPGLGFFSILTLYLIQSFQKKYKEKAKLLDVKPDAAIEIKAELKKINWKYFILITISGICTVFSKITGLYLILYFMLIILFLPLEKVNESKRENQERYQSGNSTSTFFRKLIQLPKKILDFIKMRIKQNTVIFGCAVIISISIFLFIIIRFLDYLFSPSYASVMGQVITSSFALRQTQRFDVSLTNNFIVAMFFLNAMTSVGVLGTIYLALKRQNKSLTLINFVIIFVLYISLTAFNYHYMSLVLPFLAVTATIIMHDKSISVFYFLAINFYATYGFNVDLYFEFPSYSYVSKIYSLILMLLVIFVTMIDKSKKFGPKVINLKKHSIRIPSFSRDTLIIGIMLLILIPSTSGEYINVSQSTENYGFYVVLNEINAHTNASDYVFTSSLFPFESDLKAQQLNILDTYDNKTNTYDITRLKYIIFDEFWLFYAEDAQNLTRLEDAVKEISENWSIPVNPFPVRWTNPALSPYAPSNPLLPEINPSLLVLFERPSVPTAPQTFTTMGGTNQVVLSWMTPVSSGSSPITHYRIYRGTTTGGETLLTTLGVVLTYTDSAVVGGTTYYYKVAAMNAGGTGKNSTEQSAMPF